VNEENQDILKHNFLGLSPLWMMETFEGQFSLCVCRLNYVTHLNFRNYGHECTGARFT
jgi:hypothetical protein